MPSVTAMPSAANTLLVSSLSIPTALAATPLPTYGTPASSSRPWTVPSSPYGPCRQGKTTSTSPSASTAAGRPAAVAGKPPSGHIAATSAPQATPGSSLPTIHTPSAVLRTGRTSYRLRSRLATTPAAERQETSCSPLRPPNSTATRIVVGAGSIWLLLGDVAAPDAGPDAGEDLVRDG